MNRALKFVVWLSQRSKRAAEHKLKLLTLLGRPTHVNFKAWKAVLKDPFIPILGIFGVVSLAFVLPSYYEIRSSELVGALSLLFSIVVLFIALEYLTHFIVSFATCNLTDFVFYTPLASVWEVPLLAHYCYFMVDTFRLNADASFIVEYRYLLIWFLIAQIHHTIYLTFRYPIILRRFEEEQAVLSQMEQGQNGIHTLQDSKTPGEISNTFEPQSGKSPLLVNDTEIDQGAIVMVKSEEHYIVIYTTTQSFLLRSRISDIARLLDPDLGRLVHRSYWVAKSSIVEVIQEDRRLFAMLINGEKVPIARGRRHEFHDWLQRPTR